MSVSRGFWISISLGLLLVGSTAFGDGQARGQGLNRALSAAARGSGNSGLARAAQSTTRSGSGLSKESAKLGRSANGLNRASSGMSHSQAIAAQTSNAVRIRDHRLEQVEHLREVSAQNGNARLLETADRMETSAQTNYERGAGSSRAAGEKIPSPENTTPTERAQKARTSWLPAWLRSSR